MKSPCNGYRITEYPMAPGKIENDVADSGRENEHPASKSQLKRDAQAMKTLATDLLLLSASQLQRVPLENDVLVAIQEARKFRSHGARRRQLQYIAKLIRRTDAAIIIAAVAEIQSEARGLTARQHRTEAWRETLLERGDVALGELLQQRTGVDAQHLRQLIRNARHERITGKPPVALRALFRQLRDLDAMQALPPCD
jgi:ribosome-associated protein